MCCEGTSPRQVASAQGGVASLAPGRQGGVWRKENAKAIESENACVAQQGLPLDGYWKF
ncbi:type II toxin-antitoxin system CcdA family antitoxin [Paraburkholderia sp. 32]|uniref:type II toxin-antitoxin system CcdA family antitoxin n=1 Tax=unclassified Paraburkholderia TaxID=2615204 RepID=UPI003D23D6AC